MIQEGYDVELCGTTWFVVEATPDKMKEMQTKAGDDADNADDGRTDFDIQTIYINKNLHSHRKAVTLVHEMLHVVCDSVGLDEDEKIIRQLEHGVYNLLNVFPEEYKKC